MFMCHNIYSKLYNSFRWCRMLHCINSFLKPDSLYILSFSDCTQWYSVSLDTILITVRLNLKGSWNLQLSLNCITSSSGDELWKNLPDLNRYVVDSWWWIGHFMSFSPWFFTSMRIWQYLLCSDVFISVVRAISDIRRLGAFLKSFFLIKKKKLLGFFVLFCFK